MAQIDTHRASYNRPNGNILVGKSDAQKAPTVTEQVTHSYAVQLSDRVKTCQTIAQVNDLLRIYPNAKVVKTTKTVTTITRHKRIR